MTNYDKSTGNNGTLRIALTYTQSTSSDSTTYNVKLQIINSNSATFAYGKTWDGIVGNTALSGGKFDIDGAETVTVYSNSSLVRSHDSNGNLAAQKFELYMGDTGTSGLGGPTRHTISVTPPRIPEAPGAPGKPTITNITPTGAKLSWTAAARGHANIDDYDLDISTSSSFSPEGDRNPGNALTMTVSDLLPDTVYYARARAHNGDGWGPHSATATFTTLPSTPPTLNSVTPDATGKQATLAITLPAGLSSVSSYNIWRRTPGGTWAVVKSGSSAPSQTVTGLVSGQTYEWRVSALIGTYETPFSNVITVTQPQPNTSPGAYFDGATPDIPGVIDYAFAGTAGSSISTASNLRGSAVGWLTGPQASALSGGTAVQYQTEGSIEPNGNGGARSVTYTVTVPAATNGFRAGPNGTVGFSDVTVNGQYMGSIWVQANRDRDLAAMWVWYNAGGVEIGTSLGAAVAVLADQPTRLSVLGTAPSGAVKGAVVATDPPGSSMMSAGDLLIADAAMASTGTLYPYFDGDTPDTAQFIYEWVEAQFTSPSFRESIPQEDQDPLRDPDCDPLPVPPSPPTIEDDCIEETGSWRRTWYVVGAEHVPTHLAAVPTITLSTFTGEERQVRIRWYRNPENSPPLDFDSSVWEYEQIISYIPPCSTVTIDGVSRRTWAEVGVRTGAGTAGDPYQCVPGDYPTISADRLLYGTGNVPADWPVLDCGYSWLVSLDTPLTSDAGNLTPGLLLTVRE